MLAQHPEVSKLASTAPVTPDKGKNSGPGEGLGPCDKAFLGFRNEAQQVCGAWSWWQVVPGAGGRWSQASEHIPDHVAHYQPPWEIQDDPGQPQRAVFYPKKGAILLRASCSLRPALGRLHLALCVVTWSTWSGRANISPLAV